jgi:hypothetical protein
VIRRFKAKPQIVGRRPFATLRGGARLAGHDRAAGTQVNVAVQTKAPVRGRSS